MALLKVKDDLLGNIDDKIVTYPVLLDLAGPLDTVDLYILLEHLHDRLGICGNSLKRTDKK